MNLGFLSNVTVSAAPVTKAAPVNRNIVRQPESGLRIRLFKDGSVYPSNELIAAYNLEYVKRDEKNQPLGNGFDIIDTRDMVNQINTPQHFAGVIATPRSEGKVDLFSMCRYDEVTGEPLTTVAEQGSNTYGKESLIPTLEALYGDAFVFNEQNYIDLEIVPQEISSEDKRLFVYKTIVRGADKGKKSYVVRTDAVILPLVPAAVVANDGQPDNAAAVEAEPSAANADGSAVTASKKTKGEPVTTGIDPFA